VGEPPTFVNLRGWPGRILLAGSGFALIAYLVREAGPRRVAHVLIEAGPWFPVIAALELCQIASDFLALRLLLGSGAAKVPAATWVRSSAVAYAMMVLLPAGRAAGEVARAALIAKQVGTPVAANASLRLSVAYLSANAFASAAAFCVVASWIGPRAPLAALLGGNMLLMSLSAGGLFAIARGAHIGRWLDRMGRRFGRGREPLELPPDAPREMPWRACLACTGGRCAQLVQYGVILTAVGGAFSVRNAFVAHGIHLVGATLGDLLPNQLGVVDGAYRTFARALGLGGAPARALSIAFVAHTAQLTLAAICVPVAALTRKEEPPPEGAQSSIRAGVHS
jgi:hypothetical protein